MDVQAMKRQAAEAALEHVPQGSIIGVGTGSTTNIFIELLGKARRVAGAVASSKATEARLAEAGVPVLSLEEALAQVDALAVYVDGADEFDPHRCLTKGGGGALTREKICAAASRRFVCIVDETKQVEVLGAFPLPVEVIPMAVPLVARKLREIGGDPRLREGFTTDNGNCILDVHGMAIREPAALEAWINAIPGVVTNGIFAQNRADLVLMGTARGVVVI